MLNLSRDISFLERRMQRVRTKFNRLQQDQIQNPSTSIAGIWPRQLLEQEYHDYYDKVQDRVQMRHKHDDHEMCIDQYATTKQQKWTDAILSRQLQKEQQVQCRKQINKIEDNTPAKCYVVSVQIWSTPEQNLLTINSRFEQKDYRSQPKHSRAPYQGELKTSHIGRYLIKTEYQDDCLDGLGDKEFAKPTIIKQVQRSCDSR